MRNDDDRRWLYGQMQKAGVDTGSYEEFTNSLNNQEDRDWYYNKSKSLGLDVGSSDDFTSMMADEASGVNEVSPSNQKTSNTPSSTKTQNPQKVQSAPKSTAETMPDVKIPSVADVMDKAQENQWKPKPILESEVTKDESGEEKPGTTYVPTEAERKEDERKIRQMQSGVAQTGRDIAAQDKRREKVLENPFDSGAQRVEIGNTENAFERHNPRVVEGETTYNTETGEYETTYINEAGEYSSRESAERDQEQIDRARYQEMHPDYLEQANRQQVSNLSQSIDDRLDEITKKVREETDPVEYARYTIANGGQTLETVSPGYAELQAARRYMRDAQRIIDEADHNAQSGTFGKWLESSFAGGAARGFGQKLFDVDTWDFGESDLNDAVAMMKALRDFDAGKELTEEQRMMLDAKAVELATNAYFGSYVGKGYKAGQVTAESLPFMLEMCINPASATGHEAGNILARYALRRFAKKSGVKVAEKLAEKELKRATVKAVGKEAVKKAVKPYAVAGRMAGDLVGSTVMTGTTGAVGVAADTFDRTAGQVKFKTDQNGQSAFAGHEDGERLGAAFRKAFASRTIENYSEMLGEYFAPALGVVGRGMRKGMDKIGLESVGKFIDNVSASDFARVVGDFEQHAKWNGTTGEFAEEMAGGVLNSIFVHDQTLDTDKDTGVFNLDNMIDTYLGVGLMGGFFSGLKTAGYRSPKHAARKNMERQDDIASSIFKNQDKWGQIRNVVAFGSDEDIKAVLSEVKNDESLTEDQKIAAFKYAQYAMHYKGMLMAEQKRREENDPARTDLETSFDNGYTLEGQEMNDAKNMLEAKRQSVGEFCTDDLLQEIDSDPMAALDFIRTDEGWTDEEKQTVLDYVNAKATYDGMIQHVRDDIDGKIEVSNEMIDGRVHKEDGMIYPAIMKIDNREVHIVGGKIALNADGTLDKENSDESFIIRDADTGDLEWAAPGDFLSIDSPIDAEQEKQTAAEAIRQRYAQQAADQIDGTLPFGTYDQYIVLDAEGQQHTVTVLPIDPTVENAPLVGDENNVLVSIDGGEPQVMSKELIQQMADNANLSRLAAYEQERAAQREAEKAAMEPEEEAPSYRVNDEVTLQTAEGPVHGTITEVTEDGLIVQTEQPINGKTVNLFTQDELERLTQQAEPAGTVATEENNGGEATAPTSSAEEQEPMPMYGEGEDQEPDFARVTPARAHTYLYSESGLSREEADQFVAANKKAADKEVEKVQGKKPKMGTSIAKYTREKAAWQQQLDEALARSLYWQQVLDEQTKALKAEKQAEFEERTSDASGRKTVLDEQNDLKKKVAAAREMYGGYFDDDMTVAHDVRELVAMNLPTGINWEGKDGKRGLQQELGGMSRGVGKKYDTNAFNFLLAKKGEGISFAEAVHSIWESDMNSLPNGEHRYDDTEIRDAFLDMILSSEKPSDLLDYVLNSRIAQAEAARQAEDAARMEEEAIEQENERIRQLTGMEPSEYDAFISSLEESLALQEGYENSEQYFNQLSEENDRETESEAERGEESGTGEVQGQESVEAGAEEAAEAGAGEDGTRENTDGGQGYLAQAEVTAPLSEEVNEFNKPFILASDGTTTFGEVSKESGLTEAPIKLSLGENVKDEKGENHGYGLLHIEAGHGEQIRNAGFISIEEFVETVARNYDTIREGGIVANNQTYLLEISDEHNNTLFIQLSRDGKYWNVNSAGIFKKKYSRNKQEVFTRPAVEPGTNTDSSGVDSGLSDGVTAPAGNSPETSESKNSEKSDTEQEKEEKSEEKAASYSVTPKEYVTKRGKKIEMQLVKFDKELTKEQQRAANSLARKLKGWWSKDDGGFMMRSEEDAKALADVLSDEESVKDEQPLSLQDMATATEQAPQPSAREEETTVATQQKPAPAAESAQPKRLVSDERMEELKARLRNKFRGQMNMGIDPEILAIGAELAVGHIERGLTKFADYAKAMIDDLGDAIRPYLKAFYNAVREMPEAEPYMEQMDSYDDVRTFDIANFGKNTTDAAATAAEVVREQEVEEEKAEAEQKLKEQRNDGRKVQQAGVALDGTPLREITESDLYNRDLEFYHQGKRVYIMAVMHSGEQVSSTQFSEPKVDKIYLTNGQEVKLSDLMVGDEEKEPVGGEEVQKILDIAKRGKKTSRSKKKGVSLQQEPDLFSSFGDESTNVEPNNSNNGYSRTDAVRSEGLPANGNQRRERPEQRSQATGQEGGRAERGGENSSVRISGRSSRPVPQLERPANPKNLQNNHAERGKDYAPRGVDARIEANIKAIELMQQLIESGEKATPEQMAVLRQFSGWGGLGKAFENFTAFIDGSLGRKPIPEYIRELLGEEAYQQAVMSRNSAYYTPAEVIDSLWDIARAMGFKGGNVLEGSAGIGNIIGLMPTDMSERSNIHAVEIDQTTGNILSLLYPDAKVDVQGFEATAVENGSVDLAITNVPFVTGLRVNDTTGDKDLSKKFHDIHDFCIAKNVRKLREGGIGIFITSSGTLDNSSRLREWIVQEGGSDVVGAFRLNNETFGGTGATSDIIVIRKRVNCKKSPYAIDVLGTTGERTAEYDTGETKRVKGEIVPVVKQLSMDYNQYFVEHPENMAGKMYFGFEKGDNFRPTSKALYPVQGKNQAKMLSDWAASFNEKDWETSAAEQQDTVASNVYEELGDNVKEGSIVVSNGQLCIAQRGKAVPLAVNANKVKGHTKVECFNAYQGIKDALSAVLEYQTQHDGDEGLQPLLKALNKAYDNFVKTYGHLHKNTSISFLKNDVDFSNIVALEKFSERGDVKTGKRIQEYGKTDIFSKRVVEKEKSPEPKNVKDGIIASLYLHGRVDLPYISSQLGISESEIKNEIVKQGLGFENPATRQMEVSYEYLSGNVREKLALAQANNADGRYNANIKALEKVIPMNIPAHLIDFSIGSSWIDPKLYEDYVKEKTDISVSFTSAGGTWYMKTPYYVGEQKNRAMGVRSELLHKVVMGTQLIEAAMQNKTITVSETRKNWDGSTETITDKEATQACSSKIDEIRQDFKEWARKRMQSDTAMSERIERIYNEQFNNYVPKSIPDEFSPEHLPGQVREMGGKPFKLNPHQSKAVVRGTTQPLLLAHEVGSGKTFTLISTAMEMRRLGTARKPMIVVQNATVGQFVESAKQLYPNAKVLTIEDKDHTGEGRKNFYAKIKYNDWDMIVVPQSVFERIPDSEERQMKFVQDKIEEKMLVLEQMRDADPNSSSMIVRQAEKEIENLKDELAGITNTISTKRKERDEKKAAVTRQNAEVKALEMLDRQTDDVENFDDMGIDAILVDEAHEYKHLGFATAMQRGVKGVDPSYSKKAQGVYLKTQAVLEKNNGRNVIFATGTPISNTAAEIWTFMRYLMPADTMKEYGIYYFDDFVRNFGNLQQMLEFTTSGKFKENNRFAGYINLPELVRIWSGIADTVLNKDIEAQRLNSGEKTKIPDMEGDKAQDIYLPQTRSLRSVMKYVKAELDRYDKMSGKEKKENSHIPLTMYGIAKAAAVDARLVVDDAADEPQSKTNEAVRQTLKSLEETKSYKGTVAIFADNYQNKHSGFNLYEDIRKKLIEAGVPSDQIVVMKSGMSVKKKLEIFDRVNRGEVRVIMGSTFTLGTGVNIQERLHTLIHLDAPNRPMDYTQRNGRILRQGNLHRDMNKPVRILRFGVEDSLDVTAYQRLKTKGAIADSIMNGKQMMANSMENRALEEEEDVFGDTVAQLSGSEYAMLKNQAEKDVRKYEAKKKQYEADQTYCHNEIPLLERDIQTREKALEEDKRNLAKVESLPSNKTITIGKQTFASLDEMSDFIKEYNKNIKEAENSLRDNPSIESQTRKLTVNVGGIDFEFTTELEIEVKNNEGTMFSAVHRRMRYDCPALGLKDVPVRQSLLREGLEDITKNVVSGNDFRDGIERSERIIERNKRNLAQVKERFGKPFEFEKELAKAHERYDEYAELMRKELEEKEKKYAEMDDSVEAASDITEAEEAEEDSVDEEEGIHFRLREDEPPQKTGIGYKVFVLKDGKLYPPMVANPDGASTETGVWLDADAAPVAGMSKTGRAQVKAGGKGTQGGSGQLAYRPGWHLGTIPYALQFNRKDENGEKTLFPKNFVWAEVEYANDVDYQQEAHDAGVNANGKYQHSLAGLKRVPVNGSYMYRTNPNPATDPWIITGAMKVNRILKPSEVDEMVKAAGREPQLREAGAVTDEQVDALNKEIDIQAVERRYNELSDQYNGKPYEVVQLGKMSDDEVLQAFGLSEEDKADLSQEEAHELAETLKEIARKRNTAGLYNPLTGKIVIFADTASAGKVEEAFFHENIHGILHDWYGDKARGIAERFWESGPAEGLVKKSAVERRYQEFSPEKQHEEFFTYWLGRAMVQGKVSEMLDMLNDEDRERVENILNDIGYDRESEEIQREESARDSELSSGSSDAGSRRSGGRSLRRAGGERGQSYEESLASSRAAGYSKRQHDSYRERLWRNMRKAAEDTVRKLGLGGRVTLLESAEGLKGRKARAKGWYDEKSGKIVVVLSNHGSVGDVVKTILHESVAHYGLRRLFGTHFDQFLDNVFQNADESVRREIVNMATKHGWDFREATEEYLAHLAEDTDFERAKQQGWWIKIKSMFLKMLHDIGLSGFNEDVVLTDNELRYILWRSYENLVKPGRYQNPFRVAEDVVMQSNLGVGNYDKEMARIQSLGKIDNSRRAVAESVAESEGRTHFRDGEEALARDSYERMMASGANQFTEAVQDSMLSLKKLYEAIITGGNTPNNRKGFRIEDVEGFENAYLAENRMSSSSQAQIHEWHQTFMNPIYEEVNLLTDGSREERDKLTDYMMAKHGLERNEVFARRDAENAAADLYDKEIAKLEKAHNDDPLDQDILDRLDDLKQKKADFIQAETEQNRGRDYAGLTALTGEDDVAAAEAAAQQMVDDYELEHDTDPLWEAVNNATKSSLDKIYWSGLLSKERYEQIRNMFEYYIPLQGFDETTAEDVYSYFGSDGTLGYGTPIRSAKGRKSKADDPLATIVMNGEAAIRQGNRNQMKQRFLNFVQNHPSDLVSVSDVWLRHNDVTDEWDLYFDADLREDDTPEEVERKTREFEERMEQLAESDPDHYKRGGDLPNIAYRVVKKSDLKQHQVLVKRGGRSFVLTINGNPRAAQALNGLTNPDVQTEGAFGKIMNVGQRLNRELSLFYTTRNPEFVISNYLRDLIYSNSMTWVKESPAYALKFHKNFGKMNPAFLGKLFAEWESGALRQKVEANPQPSAGSLDYYRKLFLQFMENGGETGWTNLRDIEKHKRDFEKELKRERSASRKAWKAFWGAFDLVNRSVENNARFAAFVTSREIGRSIERSIFDAKEVSVNFNKKGAGDKFLNSKGQRNMGILGSYMGGLGRGLYVFFNASIQGISNIAKASKEHPMKATAGLAAPLFLLGASAYLISNALGGGGDDDDKDAYYNLPEYIRRSNLCFRWRDDMPWVTIPLPIEFRAIYGLGELVTGVLTGNERYSNEEFAKQFASQLSQVLPLDFMEGGGGLHAFVPSQAKPLVEAETNKSWTGLPIYRDNKYTPNKPQWTRAYDSANRQIVAGTKWLNEKTGGDELTQGYIDWNPAKIEYMLKGYLGGYFTMYDRLNKSSETLFGKRDFEWRNIPIASRVLKNGDERTEMRKIRNDYFRYLDEYNKTKGRINGYKKIADSGREDALQYAERLDFLNNSDEYARFEIMDAYKSLIDAYRDLAKDAEGDEKARLTSEQNRLTKDCVDALRFQQEADSYAYDKEIEDMLNYMVKSDYEEVERAAINAEKRRDKREDEKLDRQEGRDNLKR